MLSRCSTFLEGKTWGDLPSIYWLEVALGAVLWHNPDIDNQPAI